jgi:DNA-binding GntR family transcriptional regulator
VLGRLRDYIVEGNLAAGARVPERKLCEMLGVSRTPLREALKVLAAEGLVELLPNRGARVRYFGETDIRSLFEVVAGLEMLAARLACQRITTEQIALIERLHYDMYAHYMRRDLPRYFRLNQEIHATIVRAAGNSVLEATYANISARIRRLRYSANMSNSDRWSQAMREHEEILQALSERAGQELSELMFRHVLRKCEAACEFLNGDGMEAANASEGA